MKKVSFNPSQEHEYIPELYLMITRNIPMDRIADWMAINGLRHSNQIVKRTFKKAAREDLIEYFIKEENISIGDTIKSRMTARIGKVVAIHVDGDTIEVIWETGGRQMLSKEGVFKLRSKDANPRDGIQKEDFSKVKSVLDDYGDLKK